MTWIELDVERALYVDRGRMVIVCDRDIVGRGGGTLLLKLANQRGKVEEMSEGASVAMPRYRSHKTVAALEIDSIGVREADLTAGPSDYTRRLTFRDAGFAPINAPEEMFGRYIPAPGDFYVVYADGYKSFSPRKAFLEGYTRES
ncbi:hypothetical protein ACRQ5Q_22380 [Bradyrhizobium sp. PMVTL-01]|uniref:hypothetical protein n=1 Tax=Bradyrhizobium sp. PMVTL-01 TaxID=3434999 RepID=UPI003F6F82CE